MLGAGRDVSGDIVLATCSNNQSLDATITSSDLRSIRLNKVGMCSSSKGNFPHSRTYMMTPALQISISGPEYSLNMLVWGHKNSIFETHLPPITSGAA